MKCSVNTTYVATTVYCIPTLRIIYFFAAVNGLLASVSYWVDGSFPSLLNFLLYDMILLMARAIRSMLESFVVNVWCHSHSIATASPTPTLPSQTPTQPPPPQTTTPTTTTGSPPVAGANNAGAIAGGVIGGLIGVAIIVLIIIIVAYLIWRTKNSPSKCDYTTIVAHGQYTCMYILYVRILTARSEPLQA